MSAFFYNIKCGVNYLLFVGVCVLLFLWIYGIHLLWWWSDTIKTRIQMGQANAFNVNGLYKGVGGSLVGQTPYGYVFHLLLPLLPNSALLDYKTNACFSHRPQI